jgi:hypothetical protein
MESILHRVITIASATSGIPVEKLSAQTAIDQEMNISGDDIHDFAEALELWMRAFRCCFHFYWCGSWLAGLFGGVFLTRVISKDLSSGILLP